MASELPGSGPGGVDGPRRNGRVAGNVGNVGNGSGSGSSVLGFGPGTLLEWVARYGIGTVFAVVLLIFFLSVSWRVSVDTLEAVRQVQTDQREIVRALAEVSRTVERVAIRLERVEQGR